MIWRQGDLLIESISDLPEGVEPLNQSVLASGDSTGHRHRIKDRRTARIYTLPGIRRADLFLDVTAEKTSIVHPEHAPIDLPQGRYRVWQQREFSEWGSRSVID